jgi:hypothetical protein
MPHGGGRIELFDVGGPSRVLRERYGLRDRPGARSSRAFWFFLGH